MIRKVALTNVGPLPDLEIGFGEGLNVITGDNGLGKSFLLDVVWYALTRRWPAELNRRMMSGYMARPGKASEPASIRFLMDRADGKKSMEYRTDFRRELQTWTGRAGRPLNPGLVVYAHYDGSFSVWDPARNFWRQNGDADVQERQPAFVFAPNDVWDGLKVTGKEGGEQWLCNGLIRDWLDWQKDRDNSKFAILEKLLQHLSPADMKLCAATPQRISLDDARAYPTVAMPYGDTPVIWCSAGIRRILALAYILAWTVVEHLENSRLLGQMPARNLTFLFDEVEAHLHPQWQRRIMPGILAALEQIATLLKETETSRARKGRHMQVIAVTHSALVMASLEQCFSTQRDGVWLDVDLDSTGQVQMTPREFAKHGDANGWYTSEAFDLSSTYSLKAEKVMSEAANLLKKPQPNPEQIRAVYRQLQEVLAPLDSFLFRFRALCEKRSISLS
ncbi:MAG: AAA family ATPase [Oligosphaeraceae bacterium]